VKKRTEARELALTLLYQHDLLGGIQREQISRHLAEYCREPEAREYATRLIESCMKRRDELDGLIAAAATNWEMHRMGVVERNVLRLGAYELIHEKEVPWKVAIDEAIELAKRFGTDAAGAFVNGILDKVRIQHQETAEGAPEPVIQRAAAATAETEKPGTGPDMRRLSGSADLHIHTTASDGTVGPSEVVALAAAAGLAAIAICDHDSISGIEEAEQAGSERGVFVIPGVELSCVNPERGGAPRPEIHMVGLFIDWRNAQFRGYLAELVEARRKRIHAIAEKLREAGVKVFPERIIRDAGSAAPGRMHIAEELLRVGAIKTLQEAFDRYIGDGGAAYVPKPYFTYSEAIEMIHGLGGAAVLAHPCLSRADPLIPDMAAAGMDGLEVFYPTHSKSDENRYNAMCENLGLLPSGGSDFHGSRKPDIGIGRSRLPVELMLKLYEKARAQSILRGA